MSEFLEKVEVGATGVNKLGKQYKIIWQDSYYTTKVRVRFLESGYETNVDAHNLRNGKILDRLTPSFYGIGIVGNKRDYHDLFYKKIYRHWSGMMRRVYDTKHKHYKLYGGAGVTICERWLRFDYFYDDFRKIDGYSDDDMREKGKLHLDKDIKQEHIPEGKRVYSLETCCLVSQRKNKQHQDRGFVYAKAINPAGTIFYIDNLNEFCRQVEYRIQPDKVKSCLDKEKENYMGWKFFAATKEECKKFQKKNHSSPKFPQEEDLVFILGTHYSYKSGKWSTYDESIHSPNYNQILI